MGIGGGREVGIAGGREVGIGGGKRGRDRWREEG